MRSALMCAWMRTGSDKEAKKACFERKALSSNLIFIRRDYMKKPEPMAYAGGSGFDILLYAILLLIPCRAAAGFLFFYP